jgi:hypothetical protein
LTNLNWLFKYNEAGPKEEPEWQYRGVFEPSFFGFFMSLVSVMIVLMILGFGFMGLLYLPSIIFTWCLFTYMLFTSEMKTETEWKETSGFSIVASVLKYYKTIIMIVFSLFFAKDAFKILGNGPGMFSIIVILLIYFDVIPIHLFTSEQPKEEDLFDAEKKFKVAKRWCDFKGAGMNNGDPQPGPDPTGQPQHGPDLQGQPQPELQGQPQPPSPDITQPGETQPDQGSSNTQIPQSTGGGYRRKSVAGKAFDRTFVEGSNKWVKPLKELLANVTSNKNNKSKK